MNDVKISKLKSTYIITWITGQNYRLTMTNVHVSDVEGHWPCLVMIAEDIDIMIDGYIFENSDSTIEGVAGYSNGNSNVTIRNATIRNIKSKGSVMQFTATDEAHTVLIENSTYTHVDKSLVTVMKAWTRIRNCTFHI
jgi:hypothetical protein